MQLAYHTFPNHGSRLVNMHLPAYLGRYFTLALPSTQTNKTLSLFFSHTISENSIEMLEFMDPC